MAFGRPFPSPTLAAVVRAAMSPRSPYAPGRATCAICGGRDAVGLVSWDGRDVPACGTCRDAGVPTPRSVLPPRSVLLGGSRGTSDAARRVAARQIDHAVNRALERLERGTIVEVARAIALLRADECGTRVGKQRIAYAAVRDSLYRLERAGRVKRLRRRGRSAIFAAIAWVELGGRRRVLSRIRPTQGRR